MAKAATSASASLSLAEKLVRESSARLGGEACQQFDEPTKELLVELLDEQFLNDYQQFVTTFDETLRDAFQGQRLDELAKEFLKKHADLIDSHSFGARRPVIKYPESSYNETIEEDLQIMSNHDGGADDNKRGEENGMTPEVAVVAKILAQVYWRACAGCYLRITFNKSRFGKEEDRREPVELGRRAIRYDPNNFLVCYWYMIALGWQLDVMTNPKERTMIARVFRQATMRCKHLNPDNPLAHHLLGRYYYSVAGLNWIERTVAKGLLGCKLEGTFEESEREFRRAHELDPNWLPTGLWMARVLLAQRRPKEEVRKWIEFGLQLDCKEPSSEIERAELLELRSKLKLTN